MRANTKLILILRTVFCDSSILATTSSRSFCSRHRDDHNFVTTSKSNNRYFFYVTYTDQDDVSRLNRYIGARPNGNANISPSEGGRVINAVAHHGHTQALFLQLLHFGHFMRRQHLCKHLPDPHLRSDRHVTSRLLRRLVNDTLF